MLYNSHVITCIYRWDYFCHVWLLLLNRRKWQRWKQNSWFLRSVNELFTVFLISWGLQRVFNLTLRKLTSVICLTLDKIRPDFFWWNFKDRLITLWFFQHLRDLLNYKFWLRTQFTFWRIVCELLILHLQYRFLFAFLTIRPRLNISIYIFCAISQSRISSRSHLTSSI